MELRIAGISDMAAGAVFLPGFVHHFNRRFFLPVARPEDLHRKLNVAHAQLEDVLCHREQLCRSTSHIFTTTAKQIMLEQT